MLHRNEHAKTALSIFSKAKELCPDITTNQKRSTRYKDSLFTSREGTLNTEDSLVRPVPEIHSIMTVGTSKSRGGSKLHQQSQYSVDLSDFEEAIKLQTLLRELLHQTETASQELLSKNAKEITLAH